MVDWKKQFVPQSNLYQALSENTVSQRGLVGSEHYGMMCI